MYEGNKLLRYKRGKYIICLGCSDEKQISDVSFTLSAGGGQLCACSLLLNAFGNLGSFL